MAGCFIFFSSCQNDQVDSIIEENALTNLNHSVVKNDRALQSNIIDYLSPLTKIDGQSTLDISEFDLSQIHIAHTSDKSFRTLSVFKDQSYKNQAVFIMKGNDIITAFSVKLEASEDDKIYKYTCYNDMNEPIVSGAYKADSLIPALMVNHIYNNPMGSLATKASVNTWGCNLTMLTVGTFMSVGFGMVTMGAGAAVSVAYSLAAMAICDDL